MVLWANHQTPRARPGLPPSLLTRPPPCTGSIVHVFVLLVSPPCGPHLVLPSTGSLEPSLLVSPSPGCRSRLKTFCARSSPATTRTRPQPTPAHWVKSQSNTRCQSFITKERSSIDHRDAPGPHIHFVSMELRIWHKHCFVFIPSSHFHTNLHSCTPISIFARLTMPQVKIVGMSWFVGIGWVFPTVTSGVLCAL
jgi:hypothetical protein